MREKSGAGKFWVKLTLGFLLLFTACVLPGAGVSACRDRDGRCFDVKVSGQDVVELSSSRLLQRFKSGAPVGMLADLNKTNWMLVQPVNSQPLPEFSVNEKGASWFGANPKMEMLVEPLEGQSLVMSSHARSAAGVSAKGRPLTTRENIIADKIIPPGAYLFIYTLRGAENWDRKHVLVTVE